MSAYSVEPNETRPENVVNAAWGMHAIQRGRTLGRLISDVAEK